MNTDNLSPARRKEFASVISDLAEGVVAYAQERELEAEALHRAAHILFGEADRLDPTVKEHIADNDDGNSEPDECISAEIMAARDRWENKNRTYERLRAEDRALLKEGKITKARRETIEAEIVARHAHADFHELLDRNGVTFTEIAEKFGLWEDEAA